MSGGDSWLTVRGATEALKMLYRLIVLTGPLANQRITVTREPMTLGSDSGCQLILPDEEVAPKHAILEDRGEGGLHIRDLGTMHKILVNSREVRQSRLKHGDMVEIGRTRFLVQAVVAAVVSGKEAQEKERFSPKLYLAAAAVLILGVITWWRWPENHPEVSPPKAEPELPVAAAAAQTNETPVAVETNAVAAVEPEPKRITASEFSNVMAAVNFSAIGSDNQTTQMTAEIQRIRADLAAMHEQIKSVTAPPVAAPPIAPVPPSNAALQTVEMPRPSPTLVITAAPPAVASNASASIYVAQNSLPPTNLPERPMAITLTNSATEIAAAPILVAPTGRVLRVLGVEQSRFPASDDYDDMRSFNIVLTLADPRYEITNPEVDVEIAFYDEQLASGDIKPSSVVQPVQGLRPTQAWGSDRRCTLNATYVLPKGARDRERAAGREARYYGFAVRVTYRSALQDEWALPRSLLKIASATTQTNSIKSAQANLAP